MKKYLVLFGWMVLGFVLVELSTSTLGSLNNKAVLALEFVMWWGCFGSGVFQFFKLRKAEKISYLVGTGFYEASSVSSMPRIELNLRFKFQKQHPSEDLSSLTIEELNSRLFEELKTSTLNGIEATGRGVRSIVDGIKNGAKVANELKREFADGYKSGEKIVGGSENSFSSKTPQKSGTVYSSTESVSSLSKSSHELLENNQYYKQLVRQIREYEDKIESMKSKIDDAQRSYEKYATVGDEHNNRIAASWREEKSKIEVDLRKNEKEMHELIQRKRFEEDRAANGRN